MLDDSCCDATQRLSPDVPTLSYTEPKRKADQLITAYWISFGPHGPRALPPPGEGKKIFLYTMIGCGVSFALFATARIFAGPAPPTMTKEYQEASEEFLKVSIQAWNCSCGLVTNALDHRTKDPSPLPATLACSSRASLARRTARLLSTVSPKAFEGFWKSFFELSSVFCDGAIAI